ncbi:MAG: GAF domain-containing protein [Anaerolineae bacterium]|nr:GAF domain-containing protein [Anaerolineae bacterium]
MELRFWVLTLTPLLAIFSYAILLVLVLRRAMRSRLQRAFVLYLSVMAVWSFGSAMMRLDPEHIVFWNKVLTGAGMAAPLAFFLFVRTFLQEESGPWVWAGGVILFGLELINGLGLMVTDARLLEGGLLSFDVGPAVYLTAAYGFCYYLLSFIALLAAFRRTSEPEGRNRIGYLLFGMIFVILGGSTNVISGLGAFPIDHAANLLNALLLTYAVLRYQLVDIALVFRKGLLYSIPTAIIGAAYFLIIYLAVTVFNALAGPQILLLSLVVAGIAALVAQPLRDRAQLWIDRLFFREKYDASLMLQRLSRTVASVLDLEQLTNLILDGITTTMHIERAVFFLRHERSRAFRMTARRGLARDEEVQLREDHPLVSWLQGHDEALSQFEMDMIPQFKALWGQEKRDLERLRAELFIPLKAKGELVGILAVGRKLSQEAYSPDDRLTLTTLANQTATALENARLHEETRRRNRELALLNRVIAASATSQEIEPLLRTVCRELSLAFGVSRTTAGVLDDETKEALLVTVRGSGEPESQAAGQAATSSQSSQHPRVPGAIVPLEGHPIFEQLLLDPAPIAIDSDPPSHQFAGIQASMRQEGISSLLAVPLLVEGRVSGCLCLDTIEPHAFSAEEISLAQRVAEQVSSALARAHLIENQKRLSTAVEQAAEAVIITDTEGTILYVNPAFEQITGYSHAEARGHGTEILTSGREDDAVSRHLHLSLETGRAWQGRLTNRKKDGTLYMGDTTISPVRGQAGETINYVITMRDVTREVQLEAQFHQSQKMEALGRLAGGIAHDFNNLLTIIQLSTRLLHRQLGEDDGLGGFVEQIQDAGRRAVDLTQQLLRFSRREVVDPQVLNLNQVVVDLSQMLRRIIGEDIELVTVLDETLWPVKVDPAQIEQVIMNLVVNARDAMPEGGTLTIETANMLLDEECSASYPDVQAGEHLMLSISDTGVGMNDDVKLHLFEPFFTTKEQGQGTGLGLSTVFGIVKQNEGHIQVDSYVGRGTTFRIYLPRAQVLKTQPSPRGFLDEAADVPLGTETVLVVEDAEEVLNLTAQALRTHGYHVLTAANGLDALEVSGGYEGTIHLLLTDLVMPLMGGRQLVEELQPRRPGMHVLYMSAYADRPFVKQIMSDPSTDFLPKPFTVEALTHKVRTVLDNSSGGS